MEIHGKGILPQNEVENDSSRGVHNTTAKCSTNKSIHIHLHSQPTVIYDILTKLSVTYYMKKCVSPTRHQFSSLPVPNIAGYYVAPIFIDTWGDV